MSYTLTLAISNDTEDKVEIEMGGMPSLASIQEMDCDKLVQAVCRVFVEQYPEDGGNHD